MKFEDLTPMPLVSGMVMARMQGQKDRNVKCEDPEPQSLTKQPKAIKVLL